MGFWCGLHKALPSSELKKAHASSSHRDADYFPDPARDLSEAAAAEPVEPVPFAMLTRLMVQVGRISNVLNGRRGRKRTLVNANDPPPGLLAELQNQLVELYTNMPASMRWSVDNFKHQEAVSCRCS